MKLVSSTTPKTAAGAELVASMEAAEGGGERGWCRLCRGSPCAHRLPRRCGSNHTDLHTNTDHGVLARLWGDLVFLMPTEKHHQIIAFHHYLPSDPI